MAKEVPSPEELYRKELARFRAGKRVTNPELKELLHELAEWLPDAPAVRAAGDGEGVQQPPSVPELAAGWSRTDDIYWCHSPRSRLYELAKAVKVLSVENKKCPLHGSTTHAVDPMNMGCFDIGRESARRVIIHLTRLRVDYREFATTRFVNIGRRLAIEKARDERHELQRQGWKFKRAS